MNPDAKKLAAKIDHTLLRPIATSSQIREICDQAVQYSFHSVCISPRWVKLATQRLRQTEVSVCTVAGFPLGSESTAGKVAQAKDSILDGADEIDMVADLASIIEGNEKYLTKQFKAMLKICKSMRPAVTLKVIIEAAELTDEQKVFVCKIASECGVDFVKTSTGFSKAGGATSRDVELMKHTALNCKVKAAGDIKTAQQTLAMVQAGADRIGTSSGVQIIDQLNQQS